MSVESLIKDLIKAIKESDKRKTEPYDTVATVKRVKDGTAWVHIPSGIDETPVKLTVNAKAGDKVQVRVGGGKAWITGNATAPPTDDTTAVKARYEAQSAKQSAVEAKIEAVKSAGTATEYLSVESDGVFVHAKDMPKDPTDSEARGVLIDDDVEIIREGESAASFGSDVRIGNYDNKYVSINSSAFEFNEASGSPPDQERYTMMKVMAGENMNGKAYFNAFGNGYVTANLGYGLELFGSGHDIHELTPQYGSITIGSNRTDISTSLKVEGDVIFKQPTSTFSVTTETINVSGSSTGNQANTKTISKSGYYPIGIVGFSVVSGGAYSRGCYLSESNGTWSVNARLYVQSTSPSTKECTAHILWVKTT